MPVNEQTRRERIAKALEAAGESPETLRILWRGQQERMPVIRIPIESTVLNHRSHRIRSQLESLGTVAAGIQSHPDSEEAQEAIRNLLRGTGGFESLKQNLEDEGQREPGIIARSGLLINANTRAVALHDLGQEYIEVAVLPIDATVGEIYDLELDLQVAQDFKQDYSFTNELLFVDDLINEQGRNEQEVASRLRWATTSDASSMRKGIARVKRYVRHLSLIRDIQRMSGGAISLTAFDDSEQTLQEFDTSYESLRSSQPKRAEQLKQARILGILVDLGYERQRLVDPEWVEAYLAEAFEEDPLLSTLTVNKPSTSKQGSASSTGSDFDAELFADLEDDFEEDDEDSDTHNLVRSLVEVLGSTVEGSTITLNTENGAEQFDRDTVIAAVKDAMRTAAEDARSAAKSGNALVLPIQQVLDAAKRLGKSRQAYLKVKTNAEFDVDNFVKAINEASRSLEALQIVLGK